MSFFGNLLGGGGMPGMPGPGAMGPIGGGGAMNPMSSLMGPMGGGFCGGGDKQPAADDKPSTPKPPKPPALTVLNSSSPGPLLFR